MISSRKLFIILSENNTTAKGDENKLKNGRYCTHLKFFLHNSFRSPLSATSMYSRDDP